MIFYKTSYKKLILILCALSCSCQTVVSMDLINFLSEISKKTLNAGVSTAQNQWQQHPYLYGIFGSLLTAGLLRELNNKYKVTEKSKKEIVKKLNTVTKFINTYFLTRTLAQTVKIPVDLTKGTWNTMVKQNPDIIDANLHLTAGALSAVTNLLATYTLINSSFFQGHWKDVMGEPMSSAGKIKLIGGLSLGLWYSSWNWFHTHMRAPILGDRTVNQENLIKDKKDTGSPLKEVDLDEHTFFGELTKGSTEFIKNINDPEAPRSLLLCGVPGNGKSTAAIEAAKQAGAKKIYLYHAASANNRYINGTAANLCDVLQEFITKAKNDPSTIYALIIDEVDVISGNRTKTGAGERDDAKVTTTLIKELDDAAKLTNVIIFGTSNLISDIDLAIARRFKKHEILYSPTNDRRKEILLSYIGQNSCTITSDALNHAMKYTAEFPTHAIKTVAYDICAQAKNNSNSCITLDNKDIINHCIAEQLQHLIDAYIREQNKIQKSGDESAMAENLREYNRCIQTFKTTLSDLHKEFFELDLASKRAKLETAIRENIDQQTIVKLTQECLELLLKKKKELPKTPEQNVFAAMLKALDKGDLKTFKEELKNFDVQISIFQTSLEKQATSITSVTQAIKDFAQCTETESIKKLDLCEKIKKQVDELKTEITYSTYNPQAYKAEYTQDRLCARIVEYCSGKRQDCKEILQDLEELKKNKTGLNKELYDHVLALQKTAENDTPLLEKVGILKVETSKLADMIVTSEQRKIQELINEISLEKKPVPFDDTNIDFSVVNEGPEPDVTIVEIKEEVVSEPVQRRKFTPSNKPKIQRTSSLDGSDVYVFDTLLTSKPNYEYTTSVIEFAEKEQELKQFKQIAKQQYQRTGGISWIPFSEYFCKAPKASAEEKSASYIALFLQKLFTGMTTVGTSAPTFTPESLVMVAQALQAEKPALRAKKLCALVAGCQNNDMQTIQLFGKKDFTKKEVIEFLDVKSQLLCIQKETEQDTDDLWEQLNKTVLETDFKKYNVGYKLPGQPPKKVEYSAKIFASLQQFDKLTSLKK